MKNVLSVINEMRYRRYNSITTLQEVQFHYNHADDIEIIFVSDNTIFKKIDTTIFYVLLDDIMLYP